MGNQSTFSSKQYIGIDIGTTSVKMLVIDEKGFPISQERVEYATEYLGNFRVEQDPFLWWKAILIAAKRLSGHERVNKKKISGIAVSSHAPVMLGMDRQNTPVSNALIWMDRRAEDVCKYDLAPYAPVIEESSYNPVDPYYMLSKVAWQKKCEFEKYKNTYKYLQANGWIVYLMTGKYSIDRSSAALTQFYDVKTESWAKELFSILDIDINKFPEIYEGDSEVGPLKNDVAQALGFPAGIPVLAGCYDGAAAALGLNITRPGDTFEMSGQSSGIGRVLENPCYNAKLCLFHQAIGNTYYQKGSMSSTGGSLQWFRDKIDNRPNDVSAYDDYDQLARTSVPGANGVVFLPYMMGERAPIWDSYARGLFFGLGLDTNKCDLVRAIMEGTAFGLRSILDKFEDFKSIKSIIGTGGGYSSSIWSQIKADILQVNIHVPHIRYDVTAQGVSLLNLIHQDNGFMQTRDRVTDEIIFYPIEENVGIYSKYYEIFSELYPANKLLFNKLHSI